MKIILNPQPKDLICQWCADYRGKAYSSVFYSASFRGIALSIIPTAVNGMFIMSAQKADAAPNEFLVNALVICDGYDAWSRVARHLESRVFSPMSAVTHVREGDTE